MTEAQSVETTLEPVDKVDSIQVEERSWVFFDQHFPRSEIVFFVQTILVFLLVTVSITCLAFSTTCEESTVWVAILSSAVGYMLPAPKL